jgi:hypothetical protein
LSAWTGPGRVRESRAGRTAATKRSMLEEKAMLGGGGGGGGEVFAHFMALKQSMLASDTYIFSSTLTSFGTLFQRRIPKPTIFS